MDRNAQGKNGEANDFERMLDKSLSFSQPTRGEILDAEILEIRNNEIVVGLGAKRDGIVPSQDLQRLSPELLKSLRVGQNLPVYVLNPGDRDGNLIVSLNLGLQEHDWQRAHDLLQSGEAVSVEVTGFNRGGVLVRFGRLEGFVPVSQLSGDTRTDDVSGRNRPLSDWSGTTMQANVIEVNQARRRLILSQRAVEKSSRAQHKADLLQSLKVGDIIPGTVSGIRDFGVFVNIGGADGLIHVSELEWHRVPHPASVVSVGQQLQVYVLDLDVEHQRIALSLRRTRPDPWEAAVQTYHVDQIVEGIVSNVVDFGAFVVLPDGLEGLLHISEMGDGTLVEPYSYVKRGDAITARIARIDADRKRIGFSQREPHEDSPASRPENTSIPDEESPDRDS